MKQPTTGETGGTTSSIQVTLDPSSKELFANTPAQLISGLDQAVTDSNLSFDARTSRTWEEILDTIRL